MKQTLLLFAFILIIILGCGDTKRSDYIEESKSGDNDVSVKVTEYLQVDEDSTYRSELRISPSGSRNSKFSWTFGSGSYKKPGQIVSIGWLNLTFTHGNSNHTVTILDGGTSLEVLDHIPRVLRFNLSDNRIKTALNVGFAIINKDSSDTKYSPAQKDMLRAMTLKGLDAFTNITHQHTDFIFDDPKVY